MADAEGGGVQVFITRKIPEPGLAVLREAGVSFMICQSQEDDGLSSSQLLEGVYGCQVLLPLRDRWQDLCSAR